MKSMHVSESNRKKYKVEFFYDEYGRLTCCKRYSNDEYLVAGDYPIVSSPSVTTVWFNSMYLVDSISMASINWWGLCSGDDISVKKYFYDKLGRVRIECQLSTFGWMGSKYQFSDERSLLACETMSAVDSCESLASIDFESLNCSRQIKIDSSGYVVQDTDTQSGTIYKFEYEFR
jgi:hypothetical protein